MLRGGVAQDVIAQFGEKPGYVEVPLFYCKLGEGLLTDSGEGREVVRQMFVKVGRREGGVSEILSGLAPGQKVVASGQNKLQSGTAVKINNSIDVTQLTIPTQR